MKNNEKKDEEFSKSDFSFKDDKGDKTVKVESLKAEKTESEEGNFKDSKPERAEKPVEDKKTSKAEKPSKAEKSSKAEKPSKDKKPAKDKKSSKAEKPEEDEDDEKSSDIKLTVIRIILVLIIIGSLGYIGVNRYNYYEEQKRVEALKREQEAEMERRRREAEEAARRQQEEEQEPEEIPYISEIDFDYWKNINSDVIAYIKIPDTKIDYPILYDPDDNEKYLHRDIEGNDSVHGSIYLDSVDNPDFTSQNSLLYGHHMRDGSMFKDVVKYKDKAYLDKHKDVYIYLPDRKLHLIAVGAFYGEPKGGIRQPDFESDESFQEFLQERFSNCKYKMDLPEHISQVVVLVTCSYEINNGRTFLYCVPASDFGIVDEDDGNMYGKEEENK